MATFRLDGREENNGLAKKSSVAMAFEGVFDATPKTQNIKTLTDGDIVVIGKLPEESFTTALTILIVEGFPAGSTVDVGFWNFIEETFTGIATAIDLTVTDNSVVLDLPTSGVINGGGIRTAKEGGVPIAIKYNGDDAVTGAATLLAEFASYEGYYAAKAKG